MRVPMKEALKKIIPWPVVYRIRKLGYELGYHTWKLIGGPNQRLEAPIFIIGSPRSGTTISAELFGLHPDVAGLSEAGHVWDPNHYSDPEADHYWTAEDVTSEDKDRITSRFCYYQWRAGASRFMNKHPRNSVRIDYIRAIFPDALFIHVIRDGRAVVNSILRKIDKDSHRRQVPMGAFCKPHNWRDFLRDDPAEQAALQWREIVSYILSKADELGDHYYAFTYSDLCEDPRKVLGDAYCFCGLPVTEDILSLLPEKLTAQNYKWQAQLSPSQVQTVNEILAPLLKDLGYETF